MQKIALLVSTVYPFVWPFAFILMGFWSLFSAHPHFEVLGFHISAHSLMWFMMGLAHADIFWRAWRSSKHSSELPVSEKSKTPSTKSLESEQYPDGPVT